MELQVGGGGAVAGSTLYVKRFGGSRRGALSTCGLGIWAGSIRGLFLEGVPGDGMPLEKPGKPDCCGGGMGPTPGGRGGLGAAVVP